jgi:hypothetical protein
LRLSPEVRAEWEGEFYAFALERLSLQPPPAVVSGWSDSNLIAAVSWFQASYLSAQMIPGSSVRLYTAGPPPSHLQPFIITEESEHGNDSR